MVLILHPDDCLDNGDLTNDYAADWLMLQNDVVPSQVSLLYKAGTAGG